MVGVGVGDDGPAEVSAVVNVIEGVADVNFSGCLVVVDDFAFGVDDTEGGGSRIVTGSVVVVVVI